MPWLKISQKAYSSISEYIIAFLVICSAPPYFLWNIYSTTNPLIIISIFIVAFTCNYSCLRKINYYNFIFFILLSLLFVYISIRNGDSFVAVMSQLLKCSIFLLPATTLSNIFDKFCKLYAIVLIPSILIYFIVVVLNVNLPYYIVDPLVSAKNYTYKVYPFMVQNNVLGFGAYRFEGYFDEPGVVGTVSGAILLIKGINIKKIETWIILISGLISLSLAFYIMFAISIIVHTNYASKFVLIFIVAILFLSIRDNDIFNTLITDRLRVEDGKLSGENRTSANVDYFLKDFVHSEKVFFGYGNYYAQNVVNIGGSSYKDLIINYGLFGFFIIIAIPLLSALKLLKLSKSFYIYIITFFCIIYQRPGVTSYLYFMFFYVSIFYLNKVSTNEQGKNLSCYSTI